MRASQPGGMSVLQWRRNHAPESLAHTQLIAVVALCNEIGLPLIINDQLELAMQHPVAGLHLGKEDGSLRHARQSLHTNQWLGTSCYNERSEERRVGTE